MSLKKKTIAMICAVFFLSGAMHLIVQELVVMPSFYELERERATDNMGMVLESLNRELEALSITAADWAYWDDLYHFAAGGNPEFLQATLNESALENAKLNLMNVYDPRGTLLWGMALDRSGEVLESGDISAPALPSEHPLRNLTEVTGEISGFCRTAGGPLLLNAKNILTNERTGPVNGSFVLGRLLDIAALQRMAEQVRLQLSISVVSPGGTVRKWSPSISHGVSHSPILLKETPEMLESATVIADIHGQPFLEVRVATPRAVSARGRSAVMLATVTIGCAGLLVLGLLLFMLHRTILTPLADLTRHTVKLGETDNLRSRLSFDRKDEIGALANAFDQMISRLAEARKKLVDQSFQAGIAEMASGVLHNIGNAMTPLQVQAVSLRDELRAAPVAEMKMADLELANPATAADRRQDLSLFMEMAGREMVEVIGRSEKYVADISRQVQYVQQILADQNRYTRAARVMEPLDMEDIVLDVGQALAPPMRAAMAIQVDPGMRRLGQVLASRAALQQVIANLLVNAAESIMETGMDGGRMVVHGAREEVDGIPMVHFCFEDNGRGIKEEDIEHVFERGFSTKRRNSGLGLHWSANTVNALKGVLYVKNNENRRGACLHLLLPLAAAGGHSIQGDPQQGRIQDSRADSDSTSFATRTD